ncbi:hypothetical protein [Caballeronia sp. PC1]|uniref:hypothetical protein n=1 Tax=Caballeronia sp. PC1 TaxID=2906765 RepID=UPI001F1BDDA6|nr:hypothetical protein [Caballeronia sp. PC1]MCE4547489.1 hypothetical protein [Caballeronia sp. PC1]
MLLETADSCPVVKQIVFVSVFLPGGGTRIALVIWGDVSQAAPPREAVSFDTMFLGEFIAWGPT